MRARCSFGSALIGLLLSASAVVAADLPRKARPLAIDPPAVDGINGKFDAFGGSATRHGYYGGTGSLSVPVAQQFGVQFDGLAGSYRNAFLGAVGAHAFWRNPKQGLFGLYGSYAHLDRLGGLEVARYGVEGALYVGRVTLEGIVGGEHGSSRTVVVNGLRETVDIQARFYDRIDLAYYVTDDVKVSIGHRYTGGHSQLALGGEWVFAPMGRQVGSFFVEGRIGQSEFNSVWAGLRMYFGQRTKSLIRRHREDDPVNALDDSAGAFGNSGTTTGVPARSGTGPGL